LLDHMLFFLQDAACVPPPSPFAFCLRLEAAPSLILPPPCDSTQPISEYLSQLEGRILPSLSSTYYRPPSSPLPLPEFLYVFSPKGSLSRFTSAGVTSLFDNWSVGPNSLPLDHCARCFRKQKPCCSRSMLFIRAPPTLPPTSLLVPSAVASFPFVGPGMTVSKRSVRLAIRSQVFLVFF